jgi:hypothetical protein
MRNTSDPSVHRTARVRVDARDEELPLSATQRAALSELHASALRLIDALRTGAEQEVIDARVSTYAANASLCGISPAQVRFALELLEHEHAGRRASRPAAWRAAIAPHGIRRAGR